MQPTDAFAEAYRNALELDDATAAVKLLADSPALLTQPLTVNEDRTFDILARNGHWQTAAALLDRGYEFHPTDPVSPLSIAVKFKQDNFIVRVVGKSPDRDLCMLIEAIFRESIIYSNRMTSVAVTKAAGETCSQRARAGQSEPLERWAYATARSGSLDEFLRYWDLYQDDWRRTCGKAWLFAAGFSADEGYLDLALKCGAHVNDIYETCEFAPNNSAPVKMTALATLLHYHGRKPSAVALAKRLIDLGADPSIPYSWQNDRERLDNVDMREIAKTNEALPEICRLIGAK